MSDQQPPLTIGIGAHVEVASLVRREPLPPRAPEAPRDVPAPEHRLRVEHQVERCALSDLVFEVEAASVFTDNPARNEHLLSDDFLAAESHPLIRFVMTEALPATATTGTIKGDLTVRGVTRPAEVDVTLNRIAPYPWGSNYVMGVSAEAVVRRSAFGSTYALEGGLVADEIFLAFEIEAIRQD